MSSDNTSRRLFASRLPFLGSWSKGAKSPDRDSEEEDVRAHRKAPKWSFGVLNDPETVEVPGSVLLLSDHRNEPLGLRNAPARTSHSSIPTGVLQDRTPPRVEIESDEKKTTPDGKIILEPQPEDCANDPLNWPTWRRDSALVSLGLYCMLGGGMTPILAAGFTNVSNDYGVPVSKVSLTTGLYMMGMGLGSVFASPTAILWGKRPVYLVSSVLFIVTSIWCAVSPNFPSLILARIFQGVAVSPVECLPSATIAEIFFLHERAFRIGIYTLLLLGGKNLVPLISAAIIQRLSWQWVFWIVTMVVAFCGVLLFFFVPETFWDRAPLPRSRTPTRPNFFRKISKRHHTQHDAEAGKALASPTESVHRRAHKDVHLPPTLEVESIASEHRVPRGDHRVGFALATETADDHTLGNVESRTDKHVGEKAEVPDLRSSDSPTQNTPTATSPRTQDSKNDAPSRASSSTHSTRFPWSPRGTDPEKQDAGVDPNAYSSHWREREAKSFVQQLRPWHGRLNRDNWLKAAIRPFILFSYPSVLWSAAVYSCSVGWLIVISESVAVIYREKYYDFDALQTGLVYISPFIGGVLGTAVAGKVSDIIVRAMARRNGGLYEPEFRLVMALPVALTTIIGLMGFGWSAQIRDQWIVPTVFLGVVSFGCSLGSTTSITFCVDSYRQYAGEALVTLNFSKNIFHGLVFSLFVTGWITDDGPKTVFIWIGVIQLIVLAFSVPMFIYGKRCRMWTVRRNLMEKF